MNYTERYYEMKEKFSLDLNETIHYDASHIIQKNIAFHSSFKIESNNTTDELIDNAFFNKPVLNDLNSSFTYPVLMPDNICTNKEAIILLHGLNERSWDKYLPWAHALVEKTGKAVILFPIAFHMNRSPETWKDRQCMVPFVNKRTINIPDTRDLSFVNVALSERLSRQPQRFFLSGYQAAGDILQLMDEIKSGIHPVFCENTRIDFFAYSIGALLSEVLLVANPEERFNNSKFFFFCGGSVFEGMHGNSRYIMDSQANTRLFNYYLNDLAIDRRKNSVISDLLNKTLLGNAFLSLLSYKELKNLPNRMAKRLQQQIKILCLKNDLVIPPIKIRQSLEKTEIEEWDFDFNYSHEAPFPILKGPQFLLVDKAFNRLINNACLYLR